MDQALNNVHNTRIMPLGNYIRWIIFQAVQAEEAAHIDEIRVLICKYRLIAFVDIGVNMGNQEEKTLSDEYREKISGSSYNNGYLVPKEPTI